MVRLKHRYIIGQVLLDGLHEVSLTFSAKDISIAIKDKILALYGDIGAGNFGNSLSIRFNESKYSRVFVLRCPREFEMETRFAMSCVTQIKSHSVSFRTIEIAGCERTCSEKIRRMIEVVVDSLEISKDETDVLRIDLIEKASAL